MRFNWNKLGACVAGLAVLSSASMVAERALANSSNFSWRMDKIQVDGDRNGRFHVLDAGRLTIEGQIIITERMRASASTPLPIQIQLFPKDSTTAVCTFNVDPDRAVGAAKAFSASCGEIRAGSYWLRMKKEGASKPDGDAWHNRGNGTLTTQ